MSLRPSFLICTEASGCLGIQVHFPCVRTGGEEAHALLTRAHAPHLPRELVCGKPSCLTFLGVEDPQPWTRSREASDRAPALPRVGMWPWDDMSPLPAVPKDSVKGKGPGWRHEETQHPRPGGGGLGGDPGPPILQGRKHTTYSPCSGGPQPQG